MTSVTGNSSKDIILFDMDGTLTHPREKIGREVFDTLYHLTKKCPIGIVSGSPLNYIEQQVSSLWTVLDLDSCNTDNIALYPCNGTQHLRYNNDREEWDLEYSLDMRQYMKETLGERSYQSLIRHILELQLMFVTSYDFSSLTGNFVSYRGSMLNWSPVGRDANTPEREAFIKLDIEEGIRESLCEALRVRLDATDLREFDLNLGGSTSIDIHPRGWDKTHVLRHLEGKRVWFVGDKCTPGGNDYPLWSALASTGRAFCTIDPSDTVRIIREHIMPGIKRSDT